MNCRDIEKNLPAYLEDLLSQEEKGMVREHLASCRKCSKSLEDFKSMDALLQNLKEVPPPPWLKQKILAQVREETQQEKGFLRKLFTPLRFKIPLQAFALLLITVLAVYLYRGEEPELRKNGIVIAPPAATQQQSLENSEKSRMAPSQPVRRKELPQPKEGKIRKEIKPEAVKPVDGAILALKKDFSPKKIEEGEIKQEKGKEQLFAELRDYSSPAPQADRLNNSQFQAKQSDIAVGSRAREKDMARDRKRTAQEVTTLLQQFDASKIERRISGEREPLTAELPSRYVKPFLQKLEAILGETGKNVSIGAVDAQKETVEIRIAIFKNP